MSKVSEYNPLDLFSGSKDRIYQAMTALFATPENNFRIFLNGSLIFRGLGGGMDSAAVGSHETNTDIKDLVKVSGLQLPSFLELVAEAIFSSGVLDQLLATQKLDVLDIEGAIHAYYNVISQPCMVCKNSGDPELLDQYSKLHSLPLEKSLNILRDYLIAATAKDCSLMVSFRPVEGGSTASGYNSIFLESSNQSFEYKVYISVFSLSFYFGALILICCEMICTYPESISCHQICQSMKYLLLCLIKFCTAIKFCIYESARYAFYVLVHIYVVL